MVENFPATRITTQPIESDVLVVADEHVFRSTDLGVSWEPINCDWPGAGIRSLKTFPSDPYHIYALFGGKSSLYAFLEGNSCWQKIAGQDFLPGWAIQLDIASDGNKIAFYAAVHVTSETRFFKSYDPASAWTELPRGLPAIDVFTVGNNQIFACNKNGFYVLKNGEDTWAWRGKLPLLSSIWTMTIQPNSGYLYVAGTVYKENGKSFSTIIRSTDEGQTWENAKYLNK